MESVFFLAGELQVTPLTFHLSRASTSKTFNFSKLNFQLCPYLIIKTTMNQACHPYSSSIEGDNNFDKDHHHGEEEELFQHCMRLLSGMKNSDIFRYFLVEKLKKKEEKNWQVHLPQHGHEGIVHHIQHPCPLQCCCEVNIHHGKGCLEAQCSTMSNKYFEMLIFLT